MGRGREREGGKGGGAETASCGGGGTGQAERMRRGQPPGAILCEALSHFRPREEGSGSGWCLSREGGWGEGGEAGELRVSG